MPTKYPLSVDQATGNVYPLLVNAHVLNLPAGTTLGGVAISTGSGLPTQTGHSGEYLTTNGTAASWASLDLSGYQTKAGVLALGGFSSITGRVGNANLPLGAQIRDSANTFVIADFSDSDAVTFMNGAVVFNADGTISASYLGGDGGAITNLYGLTLAANQSVRRNSGNTAYEAFVAQATNGVLALGGFSSITGRSGSANLPLGAVFYDNAGTKIVADFGAKQLKQWVTNAGIYATVIDWSRTDGKTVFPSTVVFPAPPTLLDPNLDGLRLEITQEIITAYDDNGEVGFIASPTGIGGKGIFTGSLELKILDIQDQLLISPDGPTTMLDWSGADGQGLIVGTRGIYSANEGTFFDNTGFHGSGANITGLVGDDTAYDATSWNANTGVATKNAIRDKFETLRIGTDIQAYDADLTTWAGITPGTGVGTALALNVGGAGAIVIFNGALGTPSSGVGSNLTALNATQLTSGTVPPARLSLTLAELNTAVSDADVASLAGSETLSSKTLTAPKIASIVAPSDSASAVKITKADGTTAVMTVDTTNSAVLFPSGTAALPGVQVGATDYGFYKTGSNLAASTGGTLRWYLDSGTFHIQVAALSFNDDSGFRRATTNVIGFTDGGATNGGTWRAVPRTATQVAANTDNYNPAGVSYYQRWSTDASRNITGMTFTAAQVDGQTHVITNVGAQNIVLVNESASSTAANRFHNSTGADITLAADQEVNCWYDATTARWRVTKRGF